MRECTNTHSSFAINSQDYVLCRRYRGLEQKIVTDGGLKCHIKYWAGAWEVEEIFKQL